MHPKHLSCALPMLLLALARTAAAAEATTPGPTRDAALAVAAVKPSPPQPSAPAARKAAVTPAAGTVASAATRGAPDAKPAGDVQMSGMSVLGNDDSPKSLVIVPWKGSQLGDAPGLSRLLDDATQPVDKEVFLRELSYYQIKVNSK